MYTVFLIGQENPSFSNQVLPNIKSLELFRKNKFLISFTVIYY